MGRVIENFLDKNLPADEASEVKRFLQQGFCYNGQIVIASVFVFAKEHGKSVSDVLPLMRQEWTRNWRYQHPDICGSADAPGGAGLQNRASLGNIYSALGIRSPLVRG